MKTTFDYIVVGAGSSGCTLANRLSANPGIEVLLLEAGGTDKDPMIHMPGGMIEIFRKGKHQWREPTVAQKGLNGRQLQLISGKVLGGSSSINGMLHIRGSARDYDRWAEQEGCEGWSYKDVLPYFRSTETNSEGANEHRGGQGELYASNAPGEQATTEIIQLFHSAAEDIGVQARKDFCDGEAEGVGWTQATIKNGRRHSAATAFLKPALGRPNLTVLTEAPVQKIVFDHASETPQATAVEYLHKGRSVKADIAAQGEVILCAGALRSPQLLQVSGVGERSHLESLGIAVVQDIPAVGENLHDHPTLKIQFACSEPITMAGVNIFKQIKIGLQWMLFNTGIGAWHHFDANIFTRSAAELDEADIQLQMIPLLANAVTDDFSKEHGVTFLVCLLAEVSRGSVKIRSTDIGQSAETDLGFMTDARDLEPIKRGIRFCRKLAASKIWRGLLNVEMKPGAEVDTDEGLESYIRDQVETDYHYAGTCRMGNAADEHTVVDPQLRVKGIHGLRVADASIMPLPMHGNTNHACIMIGARMADMLLDGRRPR